MFSALRSLVAQICNLPYRRFVIGRASKSSRALALANVPQNAILRYSTAQRGGARRSRNQRSADTLSASPKSLLTITRTRLSALRKNRGGLRRFAQILIDCKSALRLRVT